MAELLGARRNHARYSSDVNIDGLGATIRLRKSRTCAGSSGADILPSLSSPNRSVNLDRSPRRAPGRSLGNELNFAKSAAPLNAPAPLGMLFIVGR